MGNKIKLMLLVMAVAATGAQPLSVNAAQENVEVKTEASVENTAVQEADAETAKREAEIAAKKAAKKAEAKKVQAEEAAKAAAKAEEEAAKAQEAAEEAAKKAEEAAEALAEEEIQETRREIVEFARQFEGNPYVYGGTSLTNGADCSGFVMSVFKEFDYELPRVAAAQKDAAELKPVEEIEPGDLVFYGDYGIDHVALYIGDEKIIHASTAATGIKISDYNYRQPAAVGSYLEK